MTHLPPKHRRADRTRAISRAIRRSNGHDGTNRQSMDPMRVVFAVLLMCLPFWAQAQTLADREFDARGLTDAEKRIVQAALALSGDYLGLLDGAWGSGSQSALEA